MSDSSDNKDTIAICWRGKWVAVVQIIKEQRYDGRGKDTITVA